MIKSSITYTKGKDWWLSRRDEDGREHYPDQIRVGSLEDPRVFVPERTCAMTESHTDDSCTVRRVMDDGTIVTDEERRAVARRLRGDLEDAESNGHYCSDSEAVRYICDILGLRCSRCPHPWAGLEVLADLIEPGEPQVKRELKYRARCDELGAEMKQQRDALLKLADEIEDSDVTYSVSTQYVLDGYARRIREALGVES